MLCVPPHCFSLQPAFSRKGTALFVKAAKASNGGDSDGQTTVDTATRALRASEVSAGVGISVVTRVSKPEATVVWLAGRHCRHARVYVAHCSSCSMWCPYC